VIKMRSSPQRRQRFARHCPGAGVRTKELIADVRTRWSSTHAMIERALELRDLGSGQAWVVERGLCACVHVPEELGEAGAPIAVPSWRVRRLLVSRWLHRSMDARP
jgi:hypothetical protein